MDQVETPEVEKVSETQIADAVALFNEALEKSEHDWDAAQELFEKSFDGMLEFALSGDTDAQYDAQYNVALMYVLGINEPYDEDIDLLMEWVDKNRGELQEYSNYIDRRIDEIEHNIGIYDGDSSDEFGSAEVIDPDKESIKLVRLYLLKEKLERQGFITGANLDEYNDPEND